MADLIEINIQADVRPVNNLVSALGKASNAANLADKNMKDLERSIKRGLGGSVDNLLNVFSRLERAGMSLSDVQRGLAQDARMLAQANQAQVNSLLGVDRASKSARDSASAMAAAFDEQDRATRQTNASLQQAQRGYEQLRMAIDKNYASRMRVRQASQTLRQAVEAEVITMQQAVVMLRQYGEAARNGTLAQGNFRQGMSRSSVAIQQTGYQLGDLLVQVQSGTNFFVAFGQQATQLAGLLTMSMNPAMIKLGAALMIIIPLVTAVLGYFSRTRDSAEDAGSAIDRMGSALDDLQSHADSSGSSVQSSLENINSAARVTLELFREIAQEQLNVARNEFLGGTGIRQGLGAFDASVMQTYTAEAMSSVGRTMDEIRESMSENLTIMGLNVDQAREFDRLLQSVSGTTRDEMAQSFAEVVEQMDAAGLITDETQKLIQQMGTELGLVKALQDGVVEGAEKEAEARLRLIEAVREQVIAYTEVQRSGNEILNDLMAQVALNETILKFGEDSAEVENRRAVQAREALENALDQENITGELRDRILEAHDTNVKLTREMKDAAQATENAAKAAQDLASAIQMANSFSSGLDQNVATLEARLAEAKGEQGAVLALTIQQMEAEAELNAMRARAAGQDEVIVRARLATDRAQIERYKELNEELENFGNTSRTSGRKAEESLSDAEKAALEYAKSLDNQVISAIDSVSNAWGQFVVRGFNDFKSFANAVLNSFKSMLANMIAMAAKNRIMLSLGIGGVGAGVAGSAAAGSIGGVAGGSLLTGGGILAGTGLGTALSGLSSGFMTSVYGGLGGTAGAVSGGLAAGGIGGISTAIGAIAAPLAAVAAAFSFFRSKTKELDSGLKITVNNMDTLVQSFRTLEKSRFWGLSKKTATTTTAVESSVADPIAAAVGKVQDSVINMARSLSVGSDAFNDFSYSFDISLKGLTQEQAAAKIQQELSKVGDAMAELIPDLEKFARSGETLGQTLSRLSTSLTTVNNTFRGLGFTLFDVSMAGANAASALVDVFGGLEQFQQVTGFYFQNFYSSTEQLQAGAQNLAIVLRDLGISVLPTTRAEFRALIDTLMSAGETAKAAEVMRLAPAFVDLMNIADQVQAEAQQRANAIQQAAQESVRAAQQQYNDAVRSLREVISREKGRIEDAARSLADALKEELSIAEDNLRKQTGIVETLRDALFGRRGDSFKEQEMQLRQANDYLRSLVGQGRIEDEEAFERALGVVEKPSVDLFENFVDYQRSFGRTSNIIDELLKEQEKTLTADQQAVEALEIQIANAEEWKNRQLEALSEQASIAESTFNNVTSVREATDNVQAAIVNLNKETIAAQQAQVEATNIMKNALLSAFEKAFDLNLDTGDDPSVSGSGAAASKARAIELMRDLGKYSEGSFKDNPIDYYEIRGAKQLLAVARELNILTKGKLGSEISQEISNALYAAIRLDNKTRRMQFALGGMHSGGVRLVGEQGPELEFTGPSRIASANETKRLLSGGDDSKEEIRNLRDDLRQMHKETLMVYAKMVRLEKDQRDTLRAWDITGLPETRT